MASLIEQSGTKFPADLLTFTNEIHNVKLHFLCSETPMNNCHSYVELWQISMSFFRKTAQRWRLFWQESSIAYV